MVWCPTSRPAITTSTSSRPEPNRFRKARPAYRPRELREAGISPAKGRGQHFLTDRRILGRIAEACELTADDLVVEIGPGLGALTERLLAVAGEVIALEIDGALCAYLQTHFAGRPSLRVLEADARIVE